MKRRVKILAVGGLGLLLFLAHLHLSNKVQASGLNDTCKDVKKAVLSKTREAPFDFPGRARCSVSYCDSYQGDVVMEVKASGLPKGSSYKITLNGDKHKPGNELLKQAREYSGFDKASGEHYIDLGPVEVDSKNNIDYTARLTLSPGDYHLKVFLKQPKEPHKCVLGHDSVVFTVGQGQAADSRKTKLEFTALPDEFAGHKHMVQGRISDPSKSVYIIICPMSCEDCWVQQSPIVNRDGTWRALCYFGQEKLGIDEYFEVYALASDKKQEYTSGQTFSRTKMQGLLEKHKPSTSKMTHRVK